MPVRAGTDKRRPDLNREQKAAVIEEVTTQIRESQAVYAVDYRGLSVTQAVALRARLEEADATLRVVKNTLTERAAEAAGAEPLKLLLNGPTAFAFVRGDAALAAKALATFRRESQLLEFKGGTLGGEALTVDQMESIARLPSREVLQGQFVGVLASPVTGLVRGLAALISGLAGQLGQIRDQGLVGDGSTPPVEAEAAATAEAEAPPADESAAAETPPTEDEGAPAEEVPAEEASAEPAGEDAAADAEGAAADTAEADAPTAEAPEDPGAEAAPADDDNEAPAEGDQNQTEES